MVLEGRVKTQRGSQNAILVNIGHILQLQHPSHGPLMRQPRREGSHRGWRAHNTPLTGEAGSGLNGGMPGGSYAGQSCRVPLDYVSAAT